MQVELQWELRPPPTGDGGAAADAPPPDLAPPWMHIEPTSGHLAPGEAASITIKVGVGGGGSGALALSDPTTAEAVVRQPGAAACSLSRVFVLHVAGGADHFVVVDGVYKPSFFGLEPGTLGELVARGAPAGAWGGGEREWAWKGKQFARVRDAPFADAQWDAVPLPLKALLHFLARCAATALPRGALVAVSVLGVC